MDDERFNKFRIKILEDMFDLFDEKRQQSSNELNEKNEVNQNQLSTETNEGKRFTADGVFECNKCLIKDTCTATTQNINPKYKCNWCLLERHKYFNRTGINIEPVNNINQRTRNNHEVSKYGKRKD